MIPTALAALFKQAAGGSPVPPPPPPPPPPAPQRYYRLTISQWANAGSVGTGGAVRVTEFHAFNIAAGTVTIFPLAAQTGYSTPSPYVVTESGNLGSGFEGWRAFDGNTGDASRWASAAGSAQWLQIDVGAVSPYVIDLVQIAPDGAVSAGYYPVDLKVEGSLTGAFAGEQVLILSRTGLVQSDWTGNTLKNFTPP